MRIALKLIVIYLVIVMQSCGSKNNYSIVYQSDSLVVEQISDHIYKHISYLQTDDFGNVPCNGMIFSSDGEAFVFDTPTTDIVSKELIHWIESNLDCKVKGVVINHSHDDCLGGLNTFHKQNIPSYSSELTIEEAIKEGFTAPKNGFKNSLELTV